MSFPIAISLTRPTRSGAPFFPVLQPLAGGTTVLNGTPLGKRGLDGRLPEAVLDHAIRLAGGKGPAVLIRRDAAHDFFIKAEPDLRDFMLKPAPRRLSDSGAMVLPVNGGYWSLMLIVASDGRAAAMAYRRPGVQRHAADGGEALWLPGLTIDPEPTPLPDVPKGLLPDDPLDVSDEHILAASRWFWGYANTTLADPFLMANDARLEGLETLAWRKGSLDTLTEAVDLVFHSDPTFAEGRHPLHLQVACLMPLGNGGAEGRLSFTCNGKARFDERRAGRLLRRILAENQPICRRMVSMSSKVSGLTPAPVSLSLTVDPPPTAHQLIAATARIEAWASDRGIEL